MENIVKRASTDHIPSVPFVSWIAGPIMWSLLAVFAGLLWLYPETPEGLWSNGYLQINKFTLLIWMAVTFFSAIVATYAKSYLTGFNRQRNFTHYSLGFTLSVMLFVASNHILPFLGMWILMGVFMAKLIGVKNDWKEAREASAYAQKYFFIGSGFLTIGVLLIAYYSGQATIDAMMANISEVPRYVLLLAALSIIVSALIQSAMYPFHRWLLSAMTSPTPASALMHAGFVNGAGILLTLLSTVLIAADMLTLLFILGGLTAIIAQFTKLLQVNVKQKLACSTIAQMGFMIMQCGLGFFNATVAHMILHGFYKAYLFLSSGEEIEQSSPKQLAKLSIQPFQMVIVVLFGLLGAALFAFLTGKTHLNDSSIFLILIVAITVGQITYNFLKGISLSVWQKAVYPIVLFVLGIGAYAAVYNGVTMLMSELPMIEVPQSLSVLHIVFGVVFTIGFFTMKLGLYKKVPWVYVNLLNLSQPYQNSILTSKSSNK